MGRRTQDQICSDKKKERDHYYYERRKASKALSSGKFDVISVDSKTGEISGGTGRLRSEYRKLNNASDRANRNIHKVNSYLFKCGKRYGKMKTQKRKIQYRRSKIHSKLNQDISDEEREKLLIQDRLLFAEENNFNKLMKRDFAVVRGEVGFGFDETGIKDGSDTIWKMMGVANELIASGKYKMLVINGVEHSLDQSDLMVNLELTMFFEDLSKIQSVSKDLYSFRYSTNDKEGIIYLDFA